LLVKLLLPVMADQAIITFTTSGTHDPAERAPVPAPRHANARLLAWPAQDPDLHVSPRRAGEHAYTASKLCNLLTARYLSTLPQTISQNLSVVAYDPGATPGTGLSRSYGLVMKSAWWLLGTPIGRMIPMFSSRKDAGRGLADLVLRRVEIPPGGGYARMRRGQLVWSEPSELARDTSVAAALWHDSSQLVGIGNQTKT
jgi:NAD(P)-dependent dehydrogenase (short-subunit alcohol dehydrogenase family)